MNTRVGHIARRQARMAGLAPSPSPSPKASPDDDDEDNASFSNDDDLSVTCPLSFVTKEGVVLRLRVVLYLGGELV